MDNVNIVSKINSYLHEAARALSVWLEDRFPKVNENWWEECVLNNLTDNQRYIAKKNNIEKLSDFDLAALLGITLKSWYALRTRYFLPQQDRDCVYNMKGVRNNWAHVSVDLPGKETIISDLKTLIAFLSLVGSDSSICDDVKKLLEAVEAADFKAIDEEKKAEESSPETQTNTPDKSTEISKGSHVFVKSDPSKKGVVDSVSFVGSKRKYKVFVDNTIKTFYEGQIVLDEEVDNIEWVDVNRFNSFMTSYQINNPSTQNLYSLNSARIDFVPYQFRPALKLIQADEPRILIADSVGVGKTIEAGLIIKELEARNDLERVAIICPKPLVSERKWELEMRRFDEEFVPLDGPTFRQAIADAHRYDEWQSRYNKIIIPYSIMDSRAYVGEDKYGEDSGLEKLDPAPHFDLVIVDEAHHIRNGSMDKETAWAYKCTKFFCDNADAVVMLTATPLQTSDHDLFTLMNMLRPDIILDEHTFKDMCEPNKYVSMCSRIIRSGKENWAIEAFNALDDVRTTRWGNSMIAKSPAYQSALERLRQENITKEERVRLISDVESLHSFNTMFNRTRRRDIQNFCKRKNTTVEIEYTPEQKLLHKELIRFEEQALGLLHNPGTVPFMISTIRRQAASCIFGLAPHIKDMVNRRYNQLMDDPEIDMDKFDQGAMSSFAIGNLANKLIEMAENLPEEDSKYNKFVDIIKLKQQEKNNKVMAFSTFRHTLAYLKKRLLQDGYRVEQVDGSVSDEERYALKERFELPREENEAIDVLLFTEVGSEGLDYQFCDLMINYDLPWNPMRIEQRIGRIDRRGQQSDVVNIYNLITTDTVDAEIYNRCLLRIGVFEDSIGDCETIVGEITKELSKIAVASKLTQEELEEKLRQIEDNQIRELQEVSKLEEAEKELFGFDLSEFTTAEDIKRAENPWISPHNVQKLVETYLKEVIGRNGMIYGDDPVKTLRVNVDARKLLLDDARKLPGKMNPQRRAWENYLGGKKAYQHITFDSEAAEKDRSALLITAMHPLAKQAAQYFESTSIPHIRLTYFTNEIPGGTYPFSIFAWKYKGIYEHTRMVTVCENDQVATDFFEIIQSASTAENIPNIGSYNWDVLEEKAMDMWALASEEHKEDVRTTVNFKLASLKNNHDNLVRMLEQRINDSFDSSIRQMYTGQLEKVQIKYDVKVSDINKVKDMADILVEPMANGIVRIIGE